jgi:hypothetical protein
MVVGVQRSDQQGCTGTRLSCCPKLMSWFARFAPGDPCLRIRNASVAHAMRNTIRTSSMREARTCRTVAIALSTNGTAAKDFHFCLDGHPVLSSGFRTRAGGLPHSRYCVFKNLFRQRTVSTRVMLYLFLAH